MTDGGRAVPLADWLEARLTDVDATLAARVRASIDATLGGASEAALLVEAPSVLLHAATRQLEPLAARGCAARENAVDLLAVDTLVTLACEALSDVGADADALADGASAMVRGIAATMPELDGAA